MLAPRIVNDVSYETKLECDFSWQAQHLVT